MTESWHVLVVDDHPVVRRGLIWMLQGQSWVREVSEASTGAAAVRLATATDVSLVSIDVGLPDIAGPELCRNLLRIRPGMGVMAYSMGGDDRTVSGMLSAGARGYLLKEQQPDEIVAALRTVAGGGTALGPRVGDVSMRGGQPTLSPRLQRTTPRERSLLGGLVAGHSNRMIARRLQISEKTVRNQMSLLFGRIGVADRVQAALLAQQAGIVATY